MLISQEDYDALKNSSSVVKKRIFLFKKAYHQLKVENCNLRANSFGGCGLHYGGGIAFERSANFVVRFSGKNSERR